MDNIGLFIAIILILALSFAIVGGAWWVVLWSFGFPIAFAWKQVIGVRILTLLFNSSATYKKD